MTFQALNLKGWYFLELIYMKGRLWLKFFEYSNSLYIRVTRVIVNHVSIGKYRLRFFSRENFSCLCGSYPIESRYRILHEYKRFMYIGI